jgi:hypothetical protein
LIFPCKADFLSHTSLRAQIASFYLAAPKAFQYLLNRLPAILSPVPLVCVSALAAFV